LLKRRIVPIINENDAVSVEEITFGDNDRLAALVACAVQAQLLVVLTDVDGVLEHGKPIGRIDELTHHHTIALGSSKEISTGGMASKLAAARIVRHAGIPMIIANGTTPATLLDILGGKPVGTLIAPPSTRLKSHKWWIAFAMRRALGTVEIDTGAAQALHGGKSLLASGVREVQGRFHAGDPIAIVDERRREVARGVSNFSFGDLTRIRGLRSEVIRQMLGAQAPAEVVHRDKLVLTAEWQ
jgi:glutamate 5-kinase